MSDDSSDKSGEPEKPVRRRRAPAKAAARLDAGDDTPAAPPKKRTRKPKAAVTATEVPPEEAPAALSVRDEPRATVDAVPLIEPSPAIESLPVTGWFRRVICAGAIRAFGDKALVEVRTRPWGGWSLGLAAFSVAADMIKYFLDNVVVGLLAISVIAFVAFSVSAAAYGIARSIAPSILSMIATVLFGGMLLAEAAVGTANGAVAAVVPPVAQWQEAIARQLGRIETKVTEVAETTEEIKDTAAEIKDTTTGIEETTADIKAKTDANQQQLIDLNRRVEELVFIVKQQQEGKSAAAVGIQDAAFTQLATEVSRDVPDQDQAAVELKGALSLAVDVVSSGTTETKDDLVGTALRQIADLSRTGDFEGATNVANEAFRKWEAQAQPGQKDVSDGIELLQAGLNQDLLRRDLKAAAQRIDRIVHLQHPGAAEDWYPALRRETAQWSALGQKGLLLQYQVAIELLRLSAQEAPTLRSKVAIVNDLGTLLRGFGDWRADETLLEESLQIHRDLIKESTGKLSSNDLAVLRVGLASALIIMADRDHAIERLKEAVGLTRDAIAVFRTESDTTHLAAALTILGRGIADLTDLAPDGPLLDEGIAALRASVDLLPPTGVPGDRHLALNALGNALSQRGNDQQRVADAREAVSVFEMILAEIEKKDQPLYWAQAETNLGTAYTVLAGFEDAEANLKLAITQTEASLSVYDREAQPYDWANQQSNLGIMNMELGMVTGEAHYFDTAERILKDARIEYQKSNVPRLVERVDGLLAQVETQRTKVASGKGLGH